MGDGRHALGHRRESRAVSTLGSSLYNDRAAGKADLATSTQNKQLVFILDRTGSPRCVALEKEPAAPARRLSLFGGTSTSRKSFSAASGHPGPGIASPAVVSSDQAAGESAIVDEQEHAGTQTLGSPSATEGAGGVKGFVQSVKNVFKKSDDTTQAGAEGDDKLALSRTRTNEREKNLKLERTRSTGEPILGAPFPSYKVSHGLVLRF